MKNKLTKGLKEASEGKVKTYKSVDEIFAHIDEEKRKHPIKDFFFTLRCKLELYLIDNPRDLWQDIIAFFQRGKNGYAQKDIWRLNSYLAEVIKNSLIDLKRTKQGTPCLYNRETGQFDYNEERWNDILDQMIYSFHTAELIANGKYYYIPLNEWTYEEYFKLKKIYDIIDNDTIIMSLEDVTKYEKGLEYFKNYFVSLWD
jgi:hypothetical protein